MESVLTRTGDDVPGQVAHNENAKAYYGSIKEVFDRRKPNGIDGKRLAADAGLNFDRIIENRRIVNWTENNDVQNRIRQELEDYLFELKNKSNLPLEFDDIDRILDETLDIAKVRCP
jgi:type I restriction enzyme R subunit